MRTLWHYFTFAAICSSLPLTAIALSTPVSLHKNTTSRDSRQPLHLVNTTSNLRILPIDVDIEWEAATGMAAGAFSDVYGWKLSLDYICRVALAYPVTEEPMTPRTLSSQTGDFEIYVSGLPEGRLVNVGLVLKGFIDALWQMGVNARYEFGRWYLLLDNERRGFIEYREIPRRQVNGSAVQAPPPLSTTPSLQDVGFSTTYGHQIIPTAFLFYGALLQLLINAVSQGLDTPNYGAITHMAPLVDVWLDVKWTPHFTNRYLIELLGYISRMRRSVAEEGFRNARTTMYGSGPRGPRELASLTIGQPFSA